MFWKRKKSSEQIGREMAETLNKDFDKEEWLQKVLSEMEWFNFVFAKRSSRLYYVMIRDKEPIKKRTEEIKTLMVDFKNDIAQILSERDHYSLCERDRQVAELIKNAKFREEARYTPTLYEYFSTLTDEERLDWKKRMDRISSEIYGF